MLAESEQRQHTPPPKNSSQQFGKKPIVSVSAAVLPKLLCYATLGMFKMSLIKLYFFFKKQEKFNNWFYLIKKKKKEKKKKNPSHNAR